jgi:hypothetical protein
LQILRKTYCEGFGTGLSGTLQKWHPEDLADALCSAYLLDDADIFDMLSRIAVKMFPLEFRDKDCRGYRLLKSLVSESFLGEPD